uniref:Uncharacterized protein n=1 Tax=viral metagenome TaxID=1070528 RepID=A0A2V0R9A2_9ZZZZ
MSVSNTSLNHFHAINHIGLVYCFITPKVFEKIFNLKFNPKNLNSRKSFVNSRYLVKHLVSGKINKFDNKKLIVTLKEEYLTFLSLNSRRELKDITKYIKMDVFNAEQEDRKKFITKCQKVAKRMKRITCTTNELKYLKPIPTHFTPFKSTADLNTFCQENDIPSNTVMRRVGSGMSKGLKADDRIKGLGASTSGAKTAFNNAVMSGIGENVWNDVYEGSVFGYPITLAAAKNIIMETYQLTFHDNKAVINGEEYYISHLEGRTSALRNSDKMIGIGRDKIESEQQLINGFSEQAILAIPDANEYNLYPNQTHNSAFNKLRGTINEIEVEEDEDSSNDESDSDVEIPIIKRKPVSSNPGRTSDNDDDSIKDFTLKKKAVPSIYLSSSENLHSRYLNVNPSKMKYKTKDEIINDLILSIKNLKRWNRGCDDSEKVNENIINQLVHFN